MPLPKEISEPVLELRKQTILVYGKPKTGKTTFLSGLPNNLWLATEDGHKGIRGYMDRLYSWEQFLGDIQELSDQDMKKCPYHAVTVDTLNGLYDLCNDYVCKKKGFEHPSDPAQGKGWQLIREEFLKQLNKLIALPLGTIFIAHAVALGDDKDKAKTEIIVPDLPGKLRTSISGLANCVFYSTVEDDFEKGLSFVIKTRPTPSYQAGCHVTRLPETLPNDFKTFAEEWRKATGQTKEGK
jgi:hypothetical protein